MVNNDVPFGGDSSPTDLSSENVALLTDEVVYEQELMSKTQAWNLYASHFLSTWNMRMYEFAAIIFTAAAYPDTLLASSIRGITRTLIAICFSSTVGRWVDSSPNRLRTLTSTIIVNRTSVMLACMLWFFVIDVDSPPPDGSRVVVEEFLQQLAMPKNLLFAMILVCGIFETLSASANTLSMERDWIVVACSPVGERYDLTELNSKMRRIDLICKLISPIFISVVVSTFSTKIGVLVVGGMSACSVILEWYCAKRVWDRNPRLQSLDTSATKATHTTRNENMTVDARSLVLVRQYLEDFRSYFTSVVWVPSLALALLHLSALAYSATLITFLLSVGVSLNIITLARAAGSVVEISSTVITPIGVNRLSKAKRHGAFYDQTRTEQITNTSPLTEVSVEDRGNEVGLFRLGLWGISWQLVNLIPVIFSLWSLSSNGSSISTMITLFFFLSTSRLGLWVFDLTTQQLTQTMTVPSQRSSFAGVENSFVSFFELVQNVSVIILHRPDQFKQVATISFLAVALSTSMYAGWVWRMRGHLIHWDTIMKSCECVKTRFHGER